MFEKLLVRHVLQLVASKLPVKAPSCDKAPYTVISVVVKSCKIFPTPAVNPAESKMDGWCRFITVYETNGLVLYLMPR